jgi:hypothetical protein
MRPTKPGTTKNSSYSDSSPPPVGTDTEVGFTRHKQPERIRRSSSGLKTLGDNPAVRRWRRLYFED